MAETSADNSAFISYRRAPGFTWARLIWEGLAAQFFGSLSRLAIRGYTRSIITSRTGVDLELADFSMTVAIVVPLAVTVVAIALGAARLQSMEVA